MTEWIGLPSDSWLNSKLLKDKIMPNHHIVDHVLVGWTSFVVHRPATVDQFELTIFDKSLNRFLHLSILLVVPHAEELHLDLREFSL